jgi:hypothetical protein
MTLSIDAFTELRNALVAGSSGSSDGRFGAGQSPCRTLACRGQASGPTANVREPPVVPSQAPEAACSPSWGLLSLRLLTLPRRSSLRCAPAAVAPSIGVAAPGIASCGGRRCHCTSDVLWHLRITCRSPVSRIHFLEGALSREEAACDVLAQVRYFGSRLDLLHRHDGSGELHPGRVNRTITVRDLDEVLLVVVLGEVELAGRADLGLDLAVPRPRELALVHRA